MMKFRCGCTDNVTKMEIIFSNCSFNEACAALQKECGEPVEVKAMANDYTKIVYPSRTFYIDEIRSLVLGA